MKASEYELSYIQKKNCLTVSGIFVLSTLPLPGLCSWHNPTRKKQRQQPGKKPCASEKSKMRCRALEDETLLNSYINSGLINIF